jgi:hypothetical protein
MNSTSHEALHANAEALATLAEYLERSLDKGTSLILVRGSNGKSELFLGDTSEAPEEWARCGAIQSSIATAILEVTRSGLNELDIQGQIYRFVRMFAQVEDRGGVVFAAA